MSRSGWEIEGTGVLLKRHILDKNWHSGHLGIGTQHTFGLPSRGTKRTERKPKSQQMQRNAQRSHCNGLGSHFRVAPGGKSKTEVSLFSLAKSDQCSRLAAAPTRTVGLNIRHNYCEGGVIMLVYEKWRSRPMSRKGGKT